MKNHFALFLRICLLFVLSTGVALQPQFSVYALTTLTVTPLTWNVIGLDSNNVNVGPNDFPVGARVCNTGSEAATNVTATWNWTGAHPYVNTRPGTLSIINLGTLNAGACADAYFEVEVTRNASAYNTTAGYRIDVAAGNVTGTISTPTPRELFVEHLVSQSRNAVTNVEYGSSLASMSSVVAGGTMTLMVGNTYYIRVTGYTATQGYEQLEAFINIPNTIFQILSVSSTYDHPINPYTIDKLYSDGCTWENNVNSPNYRACLGVGKSGGSIAVTYQVKILQVPGAPLVNPEPLSTLVYDFSGSSFHYNSDYGVSTRYAYIVNAGMTKSFSPKTINPGGTSTLTFTLTNPGPSALTGVQFSDTLPGSMTLAANVTTPQCGGIMSGASGGNLIALTGGTIAAYSTCTVTAAVTASIVGTYNNTTGNLFINVSTDTGSSASDTLTVTSKPPAPSSCTTPVTLATWSFPPTGQGSGGGATAPDYTTRASDVLTSTALYTTGAAGTPAISTVQGSPAVNSWSGTDGWAASSTGFPSATTGPYFTFTVDTSNYGGVRVAFNYALLANGDWANPGNNFVYVYASADAAAYSALSTITASKGSWFASGTINAPTTGASTTAFRINAVGANKTTSAVFIDEIVITGCSLPVVPTLSKSFLTSPISLGGSSTLRFILTNPNTGSALTGVGFSDTLPTGLLVATPNALATTCSVGTLTGGTTTATAGTSTISLSGATLSANANCTISVNVLGNVAGQYTNISGTITSTETGPNTTSTGYGTSSLTVIAPPVIAKSFTANPIFTGNSTALTFTINNPNAATTLTGVSFTDNLILSQAGLVVSTPNGLSGTCGGGIITATAGTTSIDLAGAALTAGQTCTFSVNVTGSTTGLKTNSVTVSSTNGGTGNTSTANVLVKNLTPAISLLKQVSASASGPWTPSLDVTLPGSVYYRFIVENVGDVSLSLVDITDSLLTSPAPSSCSWADGDGTPLTAPFTLPVANAFDDQLAICILGPYTAVSGITSNIATADDNNPGVPSVFDTSTATYTGFTPNLGLTKTNLVTSVTAGGTTAYTLTVTNSGNIATSGTITIVDVLPAGLSIANGAVTLGGAQSANWTCNAATNVITCTSNTALAGGSGTSVFNFTVNVDATASGTVINHAQVGGGGDSTNPNPPTSTTAGQCTATDTPNEGCSTDSDTVNLVNLGLAKTNGATSVTAGTTTTYTLTVTNSGNIASSSTITIVDVLPTGLTIANGAVTLGGAQSANWTCTAATNIITCISNTVIAGSNGTSVFNFTVNVAANASGTVINHAQVGGGGDPTNPNPPTSTTAGQCTSTNTPNEGCGTDSDTVMLQSDLSLTKTNSVTSVNAGGTTTYTIRVTNNGPSDVTGAILSDPSVAGLSKTGAACSTTPGQCTALTTPSVAQLEGGAFTLPALTSGQFYEITIVATVTALSGTVANTATIAAPVGTTDPAPGNNSATDADNVTPIADLRITKDDGPTSVIANGTTIYLVRVINNGPSSVTGAVLSDPAVAGLTKTSVACSVVAGQCTAFTTPTVAQLESGTFALPALASGEWYEIAVHADVSALSGTVTNTATIAAPLGTTDPTLGNNSASDTDTVIPQADLTITKTDGVVAVNANGNTTYTVRVTNNGPSDVTGAVLSDAVAVGLSKTAVACSATPGQCASAPTAAQLESGTFALPALASGQFYEITITANVTATSGNITNTATTAAPAGTTDPTPGNNSASDIDAVNPIADLVVTKTDGVASINAGGTTTYTVTLTNNGPSAANNSTISDPAVAGLTKTAIGLCTPAGGAVCPTVGAGAGQMSIANLEAGTVLVPTLPSGGSISFNVTVNITATNGSVANTFTAAPPVGTTDPTPAAVTDTDTVNPIADLEVTKTDNVTSVNALGATTYTIVVTNHGPSDANNTVFTDPSVGGLNATGVTCASASGGAVCPTVANTTVALIQGAGIVIPTLPSGGSVTFTVNATVTVTSGSVANTANVAPPAGTSDPGVFPNTATDTDSITPLADLEVTKTDGATSVRAGGTTTYTLRVTNNGPSDVTGANLSDAATPGLSKTAVVCSGTPGQCLTAPTIAQLEGGSFALPALASGQFYEITVGANVTAISGTVTNTVTVTAPAGTTDPAPGNNTANDTDNVINIDAVNDTGSTVNGTSGGQSLANVLVNDTLNGSAATLANVNLTQVSTTNPGATLNPVDGSVNVAAGTSAGNYTVIYRICDQANPTICDTATVTVPVVVIDAVNDTGSIVNGAIGGQSLADVLANDTLNGNSATLASVNLTQVSTTNPGVTLNTTTGAVNVAPGTPSGNYTVTYQICDQANPTICDTATVSVPVAVVNAVNDTGSNVNGTIGGQAIADVLANDTLNGNSATLASIILTQISTTHPGVTLDVTTGAVNVAPGTPAGSYTVTYQICDQANPTFCDTATVTVPVVVIDAVDDDFSGTPVNGYTGGVAGNAFTNDTLNGVAVVPAQIITTVTSPASDPGVTLNTTTGSVTVAAGTPAGTYNIGYQICDQANPTLCDPATMTILVNPPAINAVDDNFSATPVNGYTGSTVGNAFTNDTLNGLAIVPAQITASVSTPASDPGVTLNTSTGSVAVAAGTPAGTYTIDYQICENVNPTNCDPATITVVVTAPVINAVNDSVFGVNGITGATAVLNVFNNDTLNGSPVVPVEVTLIETVPDPSGALTLNPNGTVDVAPGTPSGTYQLTYQICEVLNPANCDTATASVTVGLPPAPVAQDDSTTTPFNTPVTLTDITANDTAFGTGNSIVINTIDLDPASAGQQTSFTDSNGNQWNVNTTTGDVTFTPAANYTGTATISYSVQDASGQVATANLTVTVGPPASLSGVVFNDADLNGTKSAGEVGMAGVQVNLYDSTGTTLMASVTTTAGGAYSFPNVIPGTYVVVETDPAGYVSSTPNSVSATVSAGGSATVNFGDYQLPNTALSAIHGTVFNDVNGNGVQDAGETALTGVTVQLKDNGGTVIAATTTNASGGYSFPNLNAGTYTVTESDPAGYLSTTLNNVTVNLSAGTTATINFGDQISGNAIIADPAVAKLGSPTTATVGSIVVYTITVGNNGNASATNVVLSDTKPAFLDMISITISPNPGLTPLITGNTFTINFGTVAPTDSYTVTVVTRVNSFGQAPGGSNNVSITTTSSTDLVSNNSSSAALQIPANHPGGNPRPSLLPSTGFAPGIVTDLSNAPRAEYAAVGDIILEIPSLGVKIPVVGVPQKNGAWDVTWLGKQAGWLEGTAFPSWKGNSVLTSHVYLSNGLPGPFVNLNTLQYGDMIIVHAYGQKYIFEVSTNQVVEPNDVSAFQHEEQSWLTLITCKAYDEKTNTYKKRVVVRAVLVGVAWDK